MYSVYVSNREFSPPLFVLLTLAKAFHSFEIQFIFQEMGMIVISVLPTFQGLGKDEGTQESSMNKRSSVNLSCY